MGETLGVEETVAQVVTVKLTVELAELHMETVAALLTDTLAVLVGVRLTLLTALPES